MPFGQNGGMDIMFSLAPIFIGIIFIIVIGTIIFRIINGLSQWSRNNKQPILSVPAKIVAKRSEIRRHAHNNNGHHHHSTSTNYFVTFEVESGDRMELRISGNEFGQIAEDDIGQLTFQGTRFLGFERELHTGS
ncbi:DUF2500 domain-containing protein [Falsibacillus albus]|uniref:DUF2500 domain-containing protein n=1 Tax=Falsibacillus albus TaxID=2478915 RepID=A0A3L7K2I9_9BACI|nr:DUF2500 domain-containing protein [Falsibacillus albus]RLQ96201.1 DUF2500 domain-containing protein [Falsibacillus albus]